MLRQGKNQFNVKQNMEGIFNESKGIAERINMTKEQQSSELINYVRGLSSSKKGKAFGKIDEVFLNGKSAPIEKVLSELNNVFEKYKADNPGDLVVGHPFGYSENRLENARYNTVVKLFRQANKYHITDVDFGKGLILATEMMNEYGDIFKARQEFKRNPKNKFKVIGGSFGTNEAINDFISRWQKKLKENGIDVSDMEVRKTNPVLAAITLSAFRGVGKGRERTGEIKIGRDRDIEKIPPPELLSIPVYYDYTEIFGTELGKASERGINLSHLDPAMEIKLEC